MGIHLYLKINQPLAREDAMVYYSKKLMSDVYMAIISYFHFCCGNLSIWLFQDSGVLRVQARETDIAPRLYTPTYCPALLY